MQKRIRSTDNPWNIPRFVAIGIIFFFVLQNMSAGACVAAASPSDGAIWKSCFSSKIFKILPTTQGNSVIIITSSKAYLLSSENGALIDNFTRENTEATSNMESYDGSYRVAGGWSTNYFGFQSLSDAQHARPDTEWDYPLGQTLSAIEISADGSTIAVATYDNDLHLLTRSGDLLWKKIGKSIYKQIRISPDGSRITALSQNGNISYFSRKEGYLWDNTPGSPVLDFDLSQNGRFIIFGLADRSVHVLNEDAKPVTEVTIDSPVTYVSVSNTGKQFAALLVNNTILFYNQSRIPAWAISSDIPISAVTLLQEKVVSGDQSGCVYAFDNTSVFHMTYLGSNSSAIPSPTVTNPGNPTATPGKGTSYITIPLLVTLVMIIGGSAVYGLFRMKKKPAGVNPPVTQKTRAQIGQDPSQPLIPPGGYQTVTASIPEHQTRDLMDSANEKTRHIPDLVFISSKSADYQYVVTLYDFLLSHEKNVFFSQESLPMMGNADYRAEIDTAIDQAKHMIVVGSSVENILSPWVKNEWGAFIIEKRSGRKPRGNLVTVIIGSVKIDDLPVSLRMNEVIPFDPEKFSTILKYLN